MPKLIKSKGEIKIATPHPSFVAWLHDEIRCSMEWNPQYIHWDGKRYYFRAGNSAILWNVEFTKTGIIARSQEPYIWLRRGLKIWMGNGRIEIS